MLIIPKAEIMTRNRIETVHLHEAWIGVTEGPRARNPAARISLRPLERPGAWVEYRMLLSRRTGNEGLVERRSRITVNERGEPAPDPLDSWSGQAKHPFE